MNQQNDSSNFNPLDQDVAHRYAATREQKAPGELDDAVLREARRAVRADTQRGSFGAWFRPLAFALTLGLSLAIVLELSDSGLIGRQSETFSDGPSRSPSAPATDATRFGRTDLDDLKRREKPGIAGNETPEKVAADNDLESRSELRTEAPVRQWKLDEHSAETRMEKPGAALNDSSAGSRAMSDTGRDADPVPQGAARLQAVQCDNETRAAPETWWQCIESLRDAGFAEQAQRESGELRRRFPEFEIPE